jgi:hypothetical protein
MKKIIFLILSGTLLISTNLQAQDKKFHSVFIYNFTKYIEWPSAYNSGDFIIGVLGKSDITQNLQEMANMKTVGKQKMVVKVFNSVNEIGKCNMLFIPTSQSDQIDLVKSRLSNSATLIISEKNGLGRKGSGINFVVENGRWRFELNRSVVENQNLKVSSELDKLAIVI